MIDFIDRVYSGKKVIKYEDGTTETVTIENAEDATVEGTPINRENLMAIQGFIGMTTEKLTNGDILQTNAEGHTLLTHKENGVITQTFTGEKTKTKTTSKINGKIVEVIS